jgi:hypothetical protein
VEKTNTELRKDELGKEYAIDMIFADYPIDESGQPLSALLSVYEEDPSCSISVIEECGYVFSPEAEGFKLNTLYDVMYQLIELQSAFVAGDASPLWVESKLDSLVVGECDLTREEADKRIEILSSYPDD